MTAAPGTEYDETKAPNTEDMMVGESVILSLGDDYVFECLVWIAVPREEITWSFKHSDPKPVNLNRNQNFQPLLGKVRQLRWLSGKFGAL